jgi:uncharacterized membrane protein required for colicin V production
MYWAVYGIVVFAGLAMTVREGVWSNTLTLISVIVSGLVAFGFYSPLVAYLDEEATSGQHTYWLDFAVIWGLYAVTMVIIRSLLAAASKTKLRFKHPIDPVGGPIIGFLAAWVLAAFTLATLHTAPMPKNQFGGKLVYSDADTALMFMSPDAEWLRFVERVNPADALGSGSMDKFSAKGFVKIYTDRREKFDKSDGLIVKRGAA